MSTKSKSSLKSVWGVISILLIPVIFFIAKQNEEDRYRVRDEEDKEYIRIEHSNKEVKGMLFDKRMSRYWTGTVIFQLSNGEKFSTSSSTRNYKYGGVEMMFFLQVGDSIFKPAHTDSIFIYRGNKEYYFRLGMDINQ